MRTYIIALDLDGTLLDSQKQVSARNLQALAQAAERGAEIVPTTGRFFDAMPAAVRNLPFVRYAITVNGAQVYDRQTDRALVREEIALDEALAIMRMLDGHDVIYDCYQDNWGRMTRTHQEAAEAYAPDAHYVEMIRTLRTPYPDVKAYLRETGRDVQKIMLFARDLAVREEIARRLALQFPGVVVSSSTYNNLEINAPQAHKGAALARFAEMKGLSLADCIAFGDGLNDLTMVSMAGIGVAMANACAQVKEAAARLTCSNDEDGVALALAELGLCTL